MQLTPTLKTFIVGFALLINMALLFWTGIKIDVLGLGLRTEWFNIGLSLITVLQLGASALLIYLGIKAPVIGQSVIDTPKPE